MAKTEFDQGRAFRRITHNTINSLMYAEATKRTIYQEFGVVFAGLPYRYTLPDGRTLEGYTDDPLLVQQYAEMWNETSGANTDVLR